MQIFSSYRACPPRGGTLVHYSLPRPRTVSAHSRFSGNICANEWIVSPMLFALLPLVFLGNMILPHSILLRTSSLSLKFRWLSSRLQNNTSISIIKPSRMILLISHYLITEHLVMPCLMLASKCMCVLSPRSLCLPYFSQARCVCVNLQVGPICTEDSIAKQQNFGNAASWILLTLAAPVERRRERERKRRRRHKAIGKDSSRSVNPFPVKSYNGLGHPTSHRRREENSFYSKCFAW